MSCSVATKARSLKIAILTAVVGAGLAVLSHPVAAQDAGADIQAPKVNVRSFVLHPNPKFLSCIGVQGGATPTAKVTVTRGKLNDTRTIYGQNFARLGVRYVHRGAQQPAFQRHGRPKLYQLWHGLVSV